MWFDGCDDGQILASLPRGVRPSEGTNPRGGSPRWDQDKTLFDSRARRRSRAARPEPAQRRGAAEGSEPRCPGVRRTARRVNRPYTTQTPRKAGTRRRLRARCRAPWARRANGEATRLPEPGQDPAGREPCTGRRDRARRLAASVSTTLWNSQSHAPRPIPIEDDSPRRSHRVVARPRRPAAAPGNYSPSTTAVGRVRMSSSPNSKKRSSGASSSVSYTSSSMWKSW